MRVGDIIRETVWWMRQFPGDHQVVAEGEAIVVVGVEVMQDVEVVELSWYQQLREEHKVLYLLVIYLAVCCLILVLRTHLYLDHIVCVGVLIYPC